MKVLRKLTYLRKSTPRYMLYAELGRYELSITIKTRMICFWNRIITGKQSKLSYQIYKYMLELPNFHSNWIKCIKNILTEIGRIDIWNNQENIQSKNLDCVVKQALLDQNLQQWNSSLQNSIKGTNYSIFKESIQLEEYLLNLKKPDWLNFLKFRTGNHFFPCETGRWSNIDINERRCNLCNHSDVGDEYHYLLQCPFFSHERINYIKPYYYRRPNILKFKQLLSIKSLKTLQKLCAFIKIILKNVKY